MGAALSHKIHSAITFLKTRNLEETSAFYTGVLGLPLVLDQGACRIFAVTGGAYLGFCQTDGPTGSEEVILTLVLDDVDAACADLEARGVEIEIRPRNNPQYGIYQMFLRDPNGYRIEIQRFLDPNWPAGSAEKIRLPE